VVATATGGLTDIVTDERTGLLVPPADPAALAIALGRLLADRERARTLADRARVDVLQRFTPRIIADAYCALYSKVAAASGQGRPS
jgi:glycosyltransferase involved in cell wall biosynthesis